MKKTELENRCARLLRDIRRKQALTLQQIESRSGGAIKAVVLGSYERGTRSISLARITQLADFYQVPVDYFFGNSQPTATLESVGFIFDIRRINKLENLDETFEPVRRYLNRITHLRRDWNGEVLSTRSSDGDVISLMTTLSKPELFIYLRTNGLLFASEVSEQRSL